MPLRQDAGVIGLVGLAHLVSHFSQLLLAPLFPWLKDAFNASYTELGFLMTLFFVVSCAVQAASGFLVDRYGPRPILFGGPGAAGRWPPSALRSAPSYWMMACFSVVAGVGNGVFHPVDYTLLNRKVSAPRLGHAYSVHGITGSLGWALAPALLVPLAIAFSLARRAGGARARWRSAVLVVLWLNRDTLALPAGAAPRPRPGARAARGGQLRLPAHPRGVDVLRLLLLLCRGAQRGAGLRAGGGAPAARRAGGAGGDVPDGLHGVQRRRHGAGRLPGGRPGALRAGGRHRLRPGRARSRWSSAWRPFPALAVPVLFGAMGFASGIAGPSRDLLVKRSTPDNATGRVYGVVYSGLDIGQALAPLVFGALMDHQQLPAACGWAWCCCRRVLIASAFNVRRVRRTALATA